MTAPFTVKLEACSEEALEAWAIEFLRERNWVVDEPHIWETPKEVCRRLEISPTRFTRLTKRPDCPKPFAVVRGPTGRQVYIRSTGALDKFLTNGLAKTRTLGPNQPQIPNPEI